MKMRPIDGDALTRDFESQQKIWFSRDEVLDLISDAPTADAEPLRHGRWVEKNIYESKPAMIDKWQSARCPVCKKYHTTPYMYYYKVYPYCPNCGAKMDGDSDG